MAGHHKVEVENAGEILNATLTMSGWGLVDFTDVVEVKERTQKYFQFCVNENFKPTVASYALALGINRTKLWRYRMGEIRIPEECQQTLEFGCSIIAAQMESYMMDGSVHPILGVFLAKNNFGYKDTSEKINVTANLIDTTAASKLEQKYLHDIVGLDDKKE